MPIAIGTRKKECSTFFPGQRTKTPIDWILFTDVEMIVEEPPSCFPATLEALLFQPPPKSSPVRGGLSSVGNNGEKEVLEISLYWKD